MVRVSAIGLLILKEIVQRSMKYSEGWRSSQRK